LRLGCVSCRGLPRSANASARNDWSGGAPGAIPKLRAGCSSHPGGTNSDGERVRAAAAERKHAEEQVVWLMREWEELSTALAAHE